MADRIKFRFNDRFIFLRHDEPDIEALILMSGCPRACACQDLNNNKILQCSITGANDLEKLMNWLKSLDQKGDIE